MEWIQLNDYHKTMININEIMTIYKEDGQSYRIWYRSKNYDYRNDALYNSKAERDKDYQFLADKGLLSLNANYED